MADQDVSVAVVEEALRIAAESMSEQLAALDQAIEYHEGRARELRVTRTRVRKVSEIVHGPTDGRHNNGKVKPKAFTPEVLAALGERTRQRHANERAAKKERLIAWLPTEYQLDEDISAADATQRWNVTLDPGLPHNHPLRLGEATAKKLLRELRDEGFLRLDHSGTQGQEWFRLVAQ